MHMLRHLVRSKQHTRVMLPKTFLRTDSAIKLANCHFPFHCLGGNDSSCNVHYLDTELGHLAHYRDGCQDMVSKTCRSYLKDTVEDTAVLRFKDKLIARVQDALQDLQFL